MSTRQEEIKKRKEKKYDIQEIEEMLELVAV